MYLREEFNYVLDRQFMLVIELISDGSEAESRSNSETAVSNMRKENFMAILDDKNIHVVNLHCRTKFFTKAS